MSRDGMRPELLLIVDATVGVWAEQLLGGRFAVKRCPHEELTTRKIGSGTGFYVLLGGLDKLSIAAKNALVTAVQKGDATLLVAGAAPDRSAADRAFARFIGVCDAEVLPEEETVLRVFPHYLGHGLAEYETVRVRRLKIRGAQRLNSNDNVFLRNASDGAPLAFERVYGGKGRAIYLGLRADGPEADCVTCAVIENLAKLRVTADGLEGGFSAVRPGALPFDAGLVRERAGAVCRWNALCDPANGDAVYSHSALFLPTSPEFYRERKLGLWSGDFRPSRDKLIKSLSSVEIRSTDLCNEDCYYCFNRKSMPLGAARKRLPDELHESLEDDLLELARKDCLFMVRYTGPGEPLTHMRTLPSLLRFDAVGLPTALITNGALLSASDAARLKRTRSFVRFSVDAARAETYAAVRRCGPEAFSRVLDAMTGTAGGSALVGATYLICRENADEILPFCETMKRLGARAVWLRSLNEPDSFSPDEFAAVEREIKAALRLNDNAFAVFALQFYVYRAVNTLHYRYDNTRCWSLLTKAVIQPNGDVIACLSHKEFTIGNLSERPFQEIWGGKRHISLIGSGTSKKCSACIESRFNNSLEFLYRHRGDTLTKAWRDWLRDE